MFPERIHVAKIFKTRLDKAIEELGVAYEVTLQGRFDKTPIRLEIVVTSKEERNTLMTQSTGH